MEQSFARRLFVLAGLLSGLAVSLPAKPPYKVYSYLMSGDVAPLTGAAINYNLLPWNNITHVMDSFALPSATVGQITTAGLNGITLVTIAHGNATRAYMSIGGAFPAANTTRFAASTSSAANITAFVANITNTVQTFDYDGVDIDWEFPSAAEKGQFMSFMQALYTAIKAMPAAYDGLPRGLTFFISAGGSLCGVDWPNIGKYCDVGIMSGYDYYIDAYNGPLSDPGSAYGDCAGLTANGDIQGTFAKLTTSGMTAGKLALGCPLYGTPNEVSVIQLLTNGTGLVYHTPQSEFSVNFSGTITYGDNAQSFCDKINWALAHGLQGVGLWEMSYAYPPTDPTVAPLWATIGGTAACLALPTATRTPTPAVVNTVTFTPTLTGTRSATPTATLSNTPATTATFTPTLTGTRSATPTATLSNTPLATATFTPTLTGTRSATPTATLSNTPLGTATFTPTLTGTRSATPTATLSNTPLGTATFTPTLTGTRSATPTATLSNTPLGTSTFTPTLTVTRSATPTATLSSTPLGTLTFTPTLTVTRSATPTATLSNTPLGTATFTPTLTVTPSATPTATLSSTPPGTSTFTPTLTGTCSPTPTATLSKTPLNTATFTATMTLTQTPLGTLTDSPTVTESPTFSPGNTATGTPPATLSATPTSTPTFTSTQTACACAPTSTSTASPTPLLSGPSTSAPTILNVVPVPNPAHGDWWVLAVQLSGPADSLSFKAYSQAETAVRKLELPGPFAQGWNSVAVPAAGLAQDLYYLKLHANGGGQSSADCKAVRLLYLR